MLIRAPGTAFDETDPVVHEVGDRQLMAYAAGVRDTSPVLFDLDRRDGIVAHPVFPVCVEWPLVQHGAPGLEFPEGGNEAGLHVGHEITLHRPVRCGDRLTTTARLLRLQRRSVGIFALCEFRSVAADGQPVVYSREGILYRDATLEGELGEIPHAPSPQLADVAMRTLGSVALTLADAVVYGECAHIYNPMHTDVRLARANGLPDGPLLHGTATLAHCISIVVRELADARHDRVARLGCRFTGPVPMPSTLEVEGHESAGTIRFQARTSPGAPVVSHGFVELNDEHRAA
jgi:acyl dehydratase